jgi:ribonuclease Z
MSDRSLVVLGTAGESPTRHRNHNGYLLRFDDEAILFDPGEGTQRQFTFAGVSPAVVTRICITHFHGDHCLGLPGMILRLAADQGHQPVPIHYPAGGEEHFARLRLASAGQELVDVDARPVRAPAVAHDTGTWTLSCAPLAHPVECVGWRLEEHAKRHMVPERLAELGIDGSDVARLIADGVVEVGDRTVALEEASEVRAGQVVALVMDTAWCEGALEVAADADLLLCESTYLASEHELAARYGHLTAGQAGRLAAEAGVRRLVLTHFSRRYPDVAPFADEAAVEFDGEIVLATDLAVVAVPRRR